MMRFRVKLPRLSCLERKPQSNLTFGPVWEGDLGGQGGQGEAWDLREFWDLCVLRNLWDLSDRSES